MPVAHSSGIILSALTTPVERIQRGSLNSDTTRHPMDTMLDTCKVSFEIHCGPLS
jgi:hypothetical protein